MIILQVIHDFLDRARAGSEIYTYRLSKELVKKGHKVALFFCEPQYTIHLNKKFVKCIYDGMETYQIRKWPLGELSYNDRFIEDCFEKTLREVKPDIVHFQHLYGMSLRLPQIAKNHGLPTVFTLHDFWLACPMIRLYNYKKALCIPYGDNCTRCALKFEVISQGINVLTDYQRWKSVLNLCLFPLFIRRLAHYIKEDRRRMMKEVIDNIDLFIAPSKFLRDILVKDVIPGAKVVCHPYGVYLEDENNPPKSLFKKGGLSFPPLEKGGKGGFEKGFSSEKIKVMYIGQIARHKGVDILIKAFNEIDDQKAELRIYGRLIEPSLKRLIKNQNIKLMGVVSGRKKADAFSDADIVIVPSVWYENQPLVILESFLAGVPVITSNIGGMAELVKDGVNGLLFKVGDADDLRKKIKTLIDNPARIDEMAKNIDLSYIGTVKDNAEKMKEIYLKCLKN